MNQNNRRERASGADAPREGVSGERAAKLVGRRETASADCLAKVTAEEARVLALKPKPGKYRTLVIDPAWEYAPQEQSR